MGEPLVQGGRIQTCIQTRQPVSETIPKYVYGTTLNIWVVPIFEDDDDRLPVVGTYGVFCSPPSSYHQGIRYFCSHHYRLAASRSLGGGQRSGEMRCCFEFGQLQG